MLCSAMAIDYSLALHGIDNATLLIVCGTVTAILFIFVCAFLINKVINKAEKIAEKMCETVEKIACPSRAGSQEEQDMLNNSEITTLAVAKGAARGTLQQSVDKRALESVIFSSTPLGGLFSPLFNMR